MSNLQIGNSSVGEAAFGTATLINKGIVSCRTGKITKIEVYGSAYLGKTVLTGCEVATFYRPDPEIYPNHFTTRDNEVIGDVTADGTKQSFTVDLDVEEGDFIGLRFHDWENSGVVNGSNTGGDGGWETPSDQIPCTNQVFNWYPNRYVSIAGVGLTATTQDPTSILTTSVLGNGNITAIGAANATTRGFKYGLTKTDTWDVHDDGDYGTGAYTKAITGLTANTIYWVRAYAIDATGTSFGGWVKVQTAASGIIPTGTNLFIAADLSGYSFQLMRSETDDGETYTGYFVISTDLTEKQGLAFYKRILDLHLYFMSESSGTALIEVKRDNEAEWQTVGTVSLTGTADIIIQHLAPDIRAKTFLFKISADNFFRFLGVLFEYLPEDLR